MPDNAAASNSALRSGGYCWPASDRRLRPIGVDSYWIWQVAVTTASHNESLTGLMIALSRAIYIVQAVEERTDIPLENV